MEIQDKELDFLERTEESYVELIMAVKKKYPKKFPGENRHQTALRLIEEAQHFHEKRCSSGNCEAVIGGPNMKSLDLLRQVLKETKNGYRLRSTTRSKIKIYIEYCKGKVNQNGRKI